jgi:hypothetical protein
MRLLTKAITQSRILFAERKLSIFAKLGGRKALARSKLVLSTKTKPPLNRKHPKGRPKDPKQELYIEASIMSPKIRGSAI